MLSKWCKKYGISIIIFLFFLSANFSVQAQCSICTKTAAQLGEKPARGLNAGILYLALTPLAVAGIIGYKWWKKE